MSDANLAYWTWALVNFGAVVACALVAVSRIRRGDVAAHQRWMIGAGGLVVLFLVSYGVKLRVLGREDRDLWSATELGVLYLHETCIAAMLLGGALAGWRAWRFRRTLPPGPVRPRQTPSRERAAHRWAGWVAVVASGLGFVTAAGVLWGMYARAA